jgi:hypothetical protein
MDAGYSKQPKNCHAERDQPGEGRSGAQEMLIRSLGDDLRRRCFASGQSRRERISAGQRGGNPLRRLRPARGIGLETSIDHLDDLGVDRCPNARG